MSRVVSALSGLSLRGQILLVPAGKYVALLATSLAFSLSLLLRPALAQEPPSGAPASDREPTYETPRSPLTLGDPPAVGEVLLQDPLTAPGAWTAGRCPTGRNVGEFVGEGLILMVTGKCLETSTIAMVSPGTIAGLVVPDGEVQLQMKVVSGHERGSLILRVRQQDGVNSAYQAVVQPALGRAFLAKLADGDPTILAFRYDLAGRLTPEDWNTVAVRLQGQHLWLLLKDEPILSAADATYDRGSVSVGLQRLGDLNDSQESAVVLRSLVVSKLAN